MKVLRVDYVDYEHRQLFGTHCTSTVTVSSVFDVILLIRTPCNNNG